MLTFQCPQMTPSPHPERTHALPHRRALPRHSGLVPPSHPLYRTPMLPTPARLLVAVLLATLLACAPPDDAPAPAATTTKSADTTPPTWPEGATAVLTRIGATHVALKWTPASDNVGVARYHLFVDERFHAEAHGPSTVLAGLAPGQRFQLRVEAQDAVGNTATYGPTAHVTTDGRCEVGQAPAPRR